MRLQKLSHILLPVLGIVIITFVSFFLMLGYVANDADDATLKTETNILKAQLNQLATNLELTAEDNSVWNAAYENIHVNLNQEWLINNYGDDIKFFANIDSFMIYRADNTVKYTTSDVNQPTPESFLATGLDKHLQTLKTADYLTPVKTSGLVEIDQRLYVYAASLVQRFENEQAVIKSSAERRPAIVFLHEVTDQSLASISQNININGLKFVFNAEEDSHFLKIDEGLATTLFSETGNIQLVLDAQNPGVDLIQQLILPLAIVIILILLAFMYFYKRSSVLFQKLQELDQTKANFVANMSHEMRTPLNAIIGFSELIKSEAYGKIGSNKNSEYIEYIYESGNHLLAVINDILDLSKVEAGKMNLHEEVFEIKNVVNDSISILTPIIGENGLLVENKMSDVEIKTDAKLFKQIIENILSNAIKFTPSGGTTIHLSFPMLGE